MRKILVPVIGFVICFNCLSCKRGSKDETFSFDKIFYYAIQEDVKKIVESINSFNDDSLTSNQKELKRKYNTRFLFRSEKFNFNTTDTVLIKILTVFQNYWTETLMKETALKRADEKYKVLLSNLLISTNYSSNRGINQDIIRFDFENALRNLLKEKRFFARIDRTGNIMDLIIWNSQRVKTYDVNIQDTILKVPVVLIDNVLSYGWEGFATFNNFYPGGWTNPDTLFCITKDYNLNSEKFLVSYLTHETQHLFDSKKYRGGNPTWMEEYRAKLAELSVADSTVHNLLDGFIKGYKKDSKLPHPYAEFMVIKGLSKDLLKTDFVTDLNEWKKVPNTEINVASRRLLKENSHILKLK